MFKVHARILVTTQQGADLRLRKSTKDASGRSVEPDVNRVLLRALQYSYRHLRHIQSFQPTPALTVIHVQ